MKTKNKIPMRQCTGCREMKSKKEMIRVLKTPEDEIVLDTTGRKNGRGAYVCPSTECLDKAIRNHGIERSLKTSVPEEVYEDLKKELKTTIKCYLFWGLPQKPARLPAENFRQRNLSRQGKVSWFWLQMMHPRIQGKSSRTCVIFTKYRSTLLPTKKNWADSAEKNSAPALRYRMKTLQKQC